MPAPGLYGFKPRPKATKNPVDNVRLKTKEDDLIRETVAKMNITEYAKTVESDSEEEEETKYSDEHTPSVRISNGYDNKVLDSILSALRVKRDSLSDTTPASGASTAVPVDPTQPTATTFNYKSTLSSKPDVDSIIDQLKEVRTSTSLLKHAKTADEFQREFNSARLRVNDLTTIIQSLGVAY